MRNFIIIFIISLIIFSSCNFRSYDNIYLSKNLDKSIHNIEVLQKWLYWDYQNNKIPEYVLNEYNTEMERLIKKLLESDEIGLRMLGKQLLLI